MAGQIVPRPASPAVLREKRQLAGRGSVVVQFAPASPDEADYGALADTIYAVVADLTAAEASVRDAVLAALDRGDLSRARRLVERWTREPITELAAGL
jgi:hypothetical protein